MNRTKTLTLGLVATLAAIAIALLPGLTAGLTLGEAFNANLFEVILAGATMAILTLFLAFVVPAVKVDESGKRKLLIFSGISAVVLIAGLAAFIAFA
ncbi:hypothetical protein [Trueperella bialowiezensis]|uniref:Uncharacterized protein n=1 Tax=Trueperella bialowiezensis TaxID=312285 RepID=A0A448PDX2_9ACTO|nr:hypothetical protein [Trueperella bialowiezensis]VEI13112.1 Uncharacterised protein [Trueperella bialowiezensis]